MDVGIRELKAKLSEYVSRAADGEEITVTDRGTPVVRIVALEADSPIERGIAEGWVDPPRRTKLGAFRPRPGRLGVVEAVDEDRG